MEEKEILEEILKWERLKGIQILRHLLLELLDTDEKKILYEMTNGENGVKEIRAKAKIAAGKISKLWNTWYANGILEKEGQKYRKIISLKEIDLL
jgi:hypothetical protein